MNNSDSTIQNTNETVKNGLLAKQIEAILFWKAEPISVKKLATILSVPESEINNSINELEHSLEGRGIVLVRNDDEISLATGPDSSELIKKITMDEESAELGKASLETLAIILYKGPIRRSEIDYIRGVNSSFIVRNLLVRGLIQKEPDPKDSRTSLYSSSFELMGHLGITEVKNLPDFERVQEEIQKFKADKESNAKPEESKEPSSKAEDTVEGTEEGTDNATEDEMSTDSETSAESEIETGGEGEGESK